MRSLEEIAATETIKVPRSIAVVDNPVDNLVDSLVDNPDLRKEFPFSDLLSCNFNGNQTYQVVEHLQYLYLRRCYTELHHH